jgi:hypothetical protein
MFNRDTDITTALPWGPRRGAAIALLALLLLAAPAAPGFARAQAPDEPGQESAEAAEPAAAPAPVDETEAEQPAPVPTDRALRDRVEADYEVLPVLGGLLLRPRNDYRGVQTVEITEDGVAINGETMPEEAVRGWLGSRADDVEALAALSVAERRGLFGLTTDAEPAPEPTVEPEAERTDETVVEAPPAPPVPERPPREPRYRRGSQTGFGSNVHVQEDEIVDDVVVLGGSVTVDGKVDGDAVVVGGRLEINGEVEQDAAVIGGSMSLGPHAEVGGNVAVVGGSFHRDPGAVVHGKIEQVERSWQLGPWWQPLQWEGDWDTDWHGWSPWSDVGELFWSLGGLIVCALLIAIVLALGRGGVERLSDRIGLEPVKAGVVGLLVAVLLVPVFIVVSMLLIISIIGIPIFVILLLAFIFVGVPALLVIGLVGYAAVSHRVGVWLGQRFGWHLGSPFAAAFVGLLGINALTLVGRLLDLFGGPVHFFAAMFLLAGGGVELVALCVGFGAVFLHLWTRRSGGPSAGTAGTLPPVPGSPPPAAGEGPDFQPPEEQASSGEEPAEEGGEGSESEPPPR